MKKIAFLTLCTNKYIDDFLQNLITSSDKYFLQNSIVEYFIYTNKIDFPLESNRKVNFVNIEHKPYPYITLERYKYFYDTKELFEDFDYIYYCDVDMLFNNFVNEDILSNLTSVIHPGFRGSRGTPETNPESTAYIPDETNFIYSCGHFNGGNKDNFIKLSKEISHNINIDLSNNIIAIWQDESHLNRYYIDNVPTLRLPYEYCYPQNFGHNPHSKIIALDKNHEYYRN